jgi:hypothetical protein
VTVYPQVQGFHFHLQTLDVGEVKLVNFLLKLLNPGVRFASLELLVMLLGHQLSEEGNRHPPLPLLAGQFRPPIFVLRSNVAGRKEKKKHITQGPGCPLHGSLLVLKSAQVM